MRYSIPNILIPNHQYLESTNKLFFNILLKLNIKTWGTAMRQNNENAYLLKIVHKLCKIKACDEY